MGDMAAHLLFKGFDQVKPELEAKSTHVVKRVIDKKYDKRA